MAWQTLTTFAALAILLLFSFTGLQANAEPSLRDDFRAAAAYLEQHARADEVILLVPDWGIHAFTYHYRGDTPIVAMFSGVTSDTDLSAAFAPLREQYERVWLVRFQAEVSDPENHVPSWFFSRAATITEIFPSALQIKGYDFTPTSEQLPSEATALDMGFGDALRLHGAIQPVTYGSATDTHLHPPSRWIALTLYWEALEPLENVQIQVRLTKEDGQTWGLALEREHDALRRFPMDEWQTGGIYEVDVDINLNPNAPAGRYVIEVIVTDGTEEWRDVVGEFVIE